MVSPYHSDSAKTHDITPLMSDKNTVKHFSIIKQEQAEAEDEGHFLLGVHNAI